MIYARSDIHSITVSEAHGGCGVPHVRPEGERVWGLECAQCEEFLRTDTNWAGQPEDVPSTHDEQKHIASLEKNAASRQLLATEQAAGLLGLLTGPRELLTGGAPQVTGTTQCTKCHRAVAETQAFCGDCGAPVLRAVKSA